LGNRRCIIIRHAALRVPKLTLTAYVGRRINYSRTSPRPDNTDYNVALSKQDIEYIAHLASLEVSEGEIPDYAAKLGKIIEFIAELDQAETGDLLPMAHPLAMSQRLRADEVTQSNERDLYQANASQTIDGLYVVPRVVE
jgi:aspartyl-tRNA(Asn)/glutamyl-tRNA(Gln) amidotransferase subunit C